MIYYRAVVDFFCGAIGQGGGMKYDMVRIGMQLSIEELRVLRLDALRKSSWMASQFALALHDAVYPPEELHEAGFTAIELWDAGYSRAELLDAGYESGFDLDKPNGAKLEAILEEIVFALRM